eukprot:TRINITY_DN2825_c0_g1_i1.p1 TRINITY_DN2825_c0_g1~~TRINITY_DN2825_c0_g1_i1.p1  ORF type:complete len:256 (+),score=73.77 TRINITY_DN2825_c0_g1_i1:875-1642(+)
MATTNTTPQRVQKRQKVSEGIVDTYFFFICPGEKFYKWLNIPSSFPPEGIVLLGFAFSALAAFFFAYSTTVPICGLLAALCVYGNFVSDYMDGRHARSTGQCRNGGELLDHFFDPLSFSVVITGVGYAVGRLDLSLAVTIGIYGNVAIVFQEAMIMGVLTLKSIGPNEARLLYIFLGILQTCSMAFKWFSPTFFPYALLYTSALLSLGQMVVELINTVNRVNKFGPPPDNEGWIRNEKKLSGAPKNSESASKKSK